MKLLLYILFFICSVQASDKEDFFNACLHFTKIIPDGRFVCDKVYEDYLKIDHVDKKQIAVVAYVSAVQGLVDKHKVKYSVYGDIVCSFNFLFKIYENRHDKLVAKFYNNVPNL